MNTVSALRKGGSWLLEDAGPSGIFTPEKLSDEHRLIAQTTDEFVDTEVLPNLDKLETKDPCGLLRGKGRVPRGCRGRRDPCALPPI